MRRAAALLWLGVVLAAAAWVGLRLTQGVELRSDLVALLPGEEAGDAAVRVRLAEALARRVVLLVGAPERDAARAAASGLAVRLRAEGLADLSSGGMDAAGLAAVGKVYAPHRRGLLAEADRGLLREGRIDTLGERAAAKLFGFMGLVEGRQIASDPFLLLTDFFAALPLPASRLRPDEGMLSLTEAGMTWVMLTGTLSAEPYALETQRKLTTELAGLPAGVRVLRLGAAFFAGAGAERGLAESSAIGAASILGTVLLVLAAFRSLRALAMTLLAMGAGIVVAAAAVLRLFAAPHVGALIFGVSLIGVVMDYALQYASEVFAGPAAPGARLRRVFAGISIGTATTMIGYLTLWLAPFPGLRQIAVFAAVGLAGAWLSVVLWLPALDRANTDRRGAWLLGWAGRYMAGRRGGVALALAVLALAGLATVHAEDDIRRMQAPDPALLAEQRQISTLLGETAEPRFLAVAAPDDEATLRTEEAVAERLAPLRGSAVAGWQMPAQFVPSAARQAENAALAGRLDGAALAAQADRLGIDPPAPAPETPPLALGEARAVLPFLDLLVLPGASGAVHLVVLNGLRDAAAVARAVAGVPGVRMVDPAGDFSAVLGRYRLRAVALLALSAALMAPVLFWRYGRRGWRVLAAPLLAVAATPVLRALGGAGFSFFDAMALVLVLSVGVDYAVFCAETTPARRAVTGAAVALAAAAALLSFGLLAASSVAAVRGFGLSMAIGIALCFLLAPLAAPAVETQAAPHWAALRERGNALGIRLAVLVYRLGGRGACRALLAVVALWFWLADARRRGWTAAYLRRMGARRPVWDSLRIFVRFAWRGLDNFIALARPERAPPVRVEGVEVVRPLLAAGRGGVMLVCHHGNVEICRTALAARLGRRLNVMMHTRQAAHYNALLRRLRAPGATETLEVDELGPATAMALADRIERGEWIAIAADRPPLSGEKRVSRVNFLGAPAAFGQGPFILAALLDCPVVLLFCTAEGAGYTVRVQPFAARIDLPRRGRAEALAGWAARYAARLEAECRREPLQWYNFFDFWASDEAALPVEPAGARRLRGTPAPAGGTAGDAGA